MSITKDIQKCKTNSVQLKKGSKFFKIAYWVLWYSATQKEIQPSTTTETVKNKCPCVRAPNSFLVFLPYATDRSDCVCQPSALHMSP